MVLHYFQFAITILGKISINLFRLIDSSSLY